MKGATLFLLALFGSSTYASANPQDYLPLNHQWNGLSEFSALFAKRLAPITRIDTFDAQLLNPKEDILLVIYPQTLPPNTKKNPFIDFIKHGGRLLIADDFGAAAPILKALNIERQSFRPPSHVLYFRENKNLPIAHSTHPNFDTIDDVITNHPAFFYSSYPTLIGFNEEEQVLIRGHLDQGYFIALSDPSILINGMLSFAENKKLADKIVDLLVSEQSKRVYLLTGHYHSQHHAQNTSARKHRANNLLNRLNDFAPDNKSFRFLSLIVALGLFALLFSFFPLRKRSIRDNWINASTIRHRDQRSIDRNYAAGLLREKVEAELTRKLNAPGPISTIHPRWIIKVAKKRYGNQTARLIEHVIKRFADIPYAGETIIDPYARNINEKDFAAFYKRCSQLLEAIGSPTLTQFRTPSIKKTKK